MLRASCVRADSENNDPVAADEQAVVVRLPPKMAAIKATLAACQAGDCHPQDVAVVAYIMSAVDQRTGDCALPYDAIAARIGISRRTVRRAIKRLVCAGVIEPPGRAPSARVFKLTEAER